MRFRTTLILLAVFIVLLAAVLFFNSRAKRAEAAKEKEEYLVDFEAEDILRMVLVKDGETIAFKKNDEGEWFITEPVEAPADTFEVDSLANNFSSLRFDRIVEDNPADLTTYEIPRTELALWLRGREEPLRLLFGMENPIDGSLFTKRGDETRVVLIASHLKTTLDKNVFDFREKEIFTLEMDDVMSVRLRANDLRWEAVRKDQEWFFTSPIEALASGSQIDSVLRSLSGLRAKEFLSENKKNEDIQKYGLQNPPYEVVLGMPAQSKETTFFFNNEEDASFAMTSESNKIISFEGTLLDDLVKAIDELREKKVSAFYTWEAEKINVKQGEFALTAVKEDVENAKKWFLETPGHEEADGTKIEAFIRSVESLEAVTFIDSFESLAAYGLEAPDKEIRIWTKNSEGQVEEIAILIGAVDEAQNEVVVKNVLYNTLFRVEATFLEELPKEKKDWLILPPEPEEKKDGNN